jgi:Zn-dependent peptidase ImmA (M78 family)
LSRKVVPAQPRSKAQIEAFALIVLRTYQPKALEEPAPFDIERFFECELESLTGITTDYRELPPGVHGYTDSEQKESVISSDLMDDPRQLEFSRSTMAHETGHALYHVREFRQKKAHYKSIHDKKHFSFRMYRETEIPAYKNPEWQAWRFAGAILMPAPIIKAAVKEGHGLRAMAKMFCVNPAFVRTRLKGLDLFNVPE